MIPILKAKLMALVHLALSQRMILAALTWLLVHVGVDAQTSAYVAATLASFLVASYAYRAPGQAKGDAPTAAPALAIPAALKMLPLLFVGALGLTSCSKLPPSIKTAIDVAKNCSVEAVQAAGVDLIPDVETALASGQWEAELLKLVADFVSAGVACGLEAVNSSVTRVGSMAAADAQIARMDALASMKAEHAKAWLAKHPNPTVPPPPHDAP